MTDKTKNKNAHIDLNRRISELDPGELSHLRACRFCQMRIAARAELEPLHAPARMKSEIMEKLNRPGVKLAAQSCRLSRRLEFFYYSLRVGAAVLCSLTLLSVVSPALPGSLAPSAASSYAESQGFPGEYDFGSGNGQAQDGYLSGRHRAGLGNYLWGAASHFTERLNRFLNLEVLRYDDKEK